MQGVKTSESTETFPLARGIFDAKSVLIDRVHLEALVQLATEEVFVIRKNTQIVGW